jgi:crossover junction endodeoxyribonuclease RuvC
VSAGELYVLGIDPGLASTGLGLVHRNAAGRLRHVHHQVIATRPGAGAPGETWDRAKGIARAVYEVWCEHAPAVAIESWAHYGEHPTTQAHALGLVIGAILGALPASARVLEAGRAQDWRRAIGLAPTATKAEVQERVGRLLGLAELPRPQHAADALAVAIVTAGRNHALPPGGLRP